jgi:hypothetical protein
MFGGRLPGRGNFRWARATAAIKLGSRVGSLSANSWARPPTALVLALRCEASPPRGASLDSVCMLHAARGHGAANLRPYTPPYCGGETGHAQNSTMQRLRSRWDRRR